MAFPVYVNVGVTSLHPHVFFDLAAYATGIWLLARSRRHGADTVDLRIRWMVSIAALIGGTLGSHLLFAIESVSTLRVVLANPVAMLQGKTIVGGLVGGLIAVESIKRPMRVTRSTGDLMILPLAAGIAIGRIGCFLTGLEDGTAGVATSLPWGVDFGDGIARHPTQVYEIAFVALLAWIALRHVTPAARGGEAFKVFLLGYVSFRVAVDFLKPAERIGGLSVLQWVCLAVLAYYAPYVKRLASEVRHV